MKIIIFLLLALGSFLVHAESALITVKVCGGSRVRTMIQCRGLQNTVMRNVRFWAKYGSYNYNINGDSNSEWLCETSSFGTFANAKPLKFIVQPSGNTLIVRNGEILENLPGKGQNCPLEQF